MITSFTFINTYDNCKFFELHEAPLQSILRHILNRPPIRNQESSD